MGPTITLTYTAPNGGKRTIDRGVRQTASGWLALEVHRDASDGHKVAEKLIAGPFGRGKAAHIAGSTKEI